MPYSEEKRDYSATMWSIFKNTSSRPIIVLFLLSLLAFLIYSNTFSVPFQVDDFGNIVDYSPVRDLAGFIGLSGTRYVGYLTFALNYRFGGLDVFGYHLVNLLIHILNGFLVYSFVLLLFRAAWSCQSAIPSESQYSIHDQQPSVAHWVALAAALLFIAHPVQTQAVTYVVQRFASLMTLFYLGAVVCYLKWRLSSGRKSHHVWYGIALLATVLAMKTKENSFTLPFMILLMEAVFFKTPARKRWLFVVPFLLTLSIIPLTHMYVLGDSDVGFARETVDISRSSYLFTQFRVVITYIRLLFWPVNQTFEYAYPIYHSLLDSAVLFSVLFLFGLLVSAAYLLWRTGRGTNGLQQANPVFFRLIAFGILWFFLTLSVESSIFPIRDVIFEHRLYLPSIGIFLVVGLVWKLLCGQQFSISRRRKALCLLPLTVIILFLSIATYQRNQIWIDPVTLWRDAVMKAPNKARAHYGLGLFGYAAQGQWGAAIEEYERALRYSPRSAWIHVSLGEAYSAIKRFDQAVREYHTALSIQQPDDPTFSRSTIHYSLGNIYAAQGRWGAAIEEYKNALRYQPDYVEAYNNLGNAYAAQGRWDEAIDQYKAALKLKPNATEVRNNLGNAYRHK